MADTLTPNLSLVKAAQGDQGWWPNHIANWDKIDALWASATRTPGSVLFYNSANKIAIDNTNLFWDATNLRLGIGTAAPLRQQHILGLGQTVAALTDAGNTGGTLYVQDSAGGTGNGGTILFGALQGFNAAIKNLLTDGAVNSRGALAFSTRNLAADTALTERMRIVSDGSIGIGTAAPIRQQHIFGNGQAIAALTDVGNTGGTLYVQDNNGFTGSGGAILFGASQGFNAAIKNLLIDGASNTRGALAFSLRNLVTDVALTERMRIMSDGSIGIGTATPAASALIDMTSTTQAFLPPRMTTTQRDALTAVDGMIIYNSTTGALNYRKAGVWTAI